MAGTVVTIGNFDGVHAGHAALLRCAREVAARAGPGTGVLALCFDPHPATVLRPRRAPARLSTFDQRRAWLTELGADEVRRLEPTPELLAAAPEAFVERLVAEHHPRGVVEGSDFRFGRGRGGDAGTLRACGARHGFAVEIVEPVHVTMSDQTLAVASSTMIRWLVLHGRVGDAAGTLGRPYELVGDVVAGDRRGRRIGFPTANLRAECLAPGDGVYAAWAVLEDGRRFPAAVSVGNKPTFPGRERAVEAFLIGVGGGGAWQPVPGLPEYGWRLRLAFRAWIRDQVRFESVPLLVDQMHRDCGRVLEALGAAVPHAEVA